MRPFDIIQISADINLMLRDTKGLPIQALKLIPGNSSGLNSAKIGVYNSGDLETGASGSSAGAPPVRLAIDKVFRRHYQQCLLINRETQRSRSC